MTTKKRKGGVSVAPLRAGLSLCNLSSQDGQQQQDNEDTQPGLPHSAHGHQPWWVWSPQLMVRNTRNARGELRREITTEAKPGWPHQLGADGPEGPLRMASSQDRKATIAFPAFTDTPTASQQVP